MGDSRKRARCHGFHGLLLRHGAKSAPGYGTSRAPHARDATLARAITCIRMYSHPWNGASRALENLAQWQADMVTALLERAARWEGEGRPAFRWHDSGDIQSAAHLAAICAVARATPGIDHWLPTREFGYTAEYFSAGGKRPKNLTIRLSAHMIDGTAPIALARKYRLTVSTVHTAENNYPAASICPAYRQGGECGECGECRNCWNNKVAHVSYPKH